MKKLLRILLFIFFLNFAPIASNAQYTLLYSFNGSVGNLPSGNVTFLHNKCYGITNQGGGNNEGVLFSLDTNWTNYKILHSFGLGNDGSYPSGALVQLGDKFYGTAYEGGANTYGLIFSIDTGGNNYKAVYNFGTVTDDGRYPEALILAGAKWFGIAQEGGIYSSGAIYSIDTDGSNYKVLYSFGSVSNDGYYPSGFIVIGNKCYGTCEEGGSDSAGIIFSLDTNGSNYTIMHNFGAISNDGRNGYGSLTLVGNKLYGMTWYGGTHDSGAIYSIDTNGNNYYVIHDFRTVNNDGYATYGALTLAGNRCYGMTYFGGTNNWGAIFSMDTNGSNYTILHNFTGYDGEGPNGSLVSVGNKWYGMTTLGGIDGYGAIFSLEDTTLIMTGVESSLIDGGLWSVYPNPSSGIFTMQSSVVSLSGESQGDKWSVEVYNVLGEMVETQCIASLQTAFSIDLRSKPNGIYFYRVINEDGTMLGKGKLVIQK